MEKHKGIGRFDSVSIAGMAVFGALAILLSIISQAFGLYFVPPVNYLQFDFGEVAIFLSLFVFGPIPAIVSAFVEFLGLMIYGHNVPIGPLFKLIAVLASLLGIWLGVVMVSRLGNHPSLPRALGTGAILGTFSRVVVTTIANYFLLEIFVVQGFVKTGLVPLYLVLTAVFNVLQLVLAVGLSSLVMASPQVRSARAAGKSLWIISLLRAKTLKTETLSSSAHDSEVRP